MTAPVNVPAASAEEKALMAEQTALLRQQSQIMTSQLEQQKTLLPFFAKEAGVDLQFDEDGNITGATKIKTELDLQNEEIQGKFNERTLAALGGTLPVDPALEASLETAEQTLREKLQNQFGPGYETSTPAIQTLEEFRKSSEQLRYGARTGQLTLAEQLGLARREMSGSEQGQDLNIFRGSAIGDPAMISGGIGNVAAGYQNPISTYANNRSQQFQANMFNAQQQSQMLGGFGKLAGMLFGNLMMPGLGGVAAGGVW